MLEQKVVSTVSVSSDNDYKMLEDLVASRVAKAPKELFTTDVEGLFDIYLAGIPVESRKHYDCNCCRRFVDRFGGIVTISNDGYHNPLLWYWADGPKFFESSMLNMYDAVKSAKVNGIFLADEYTLGTPSNVAGPGSKYEGVRWSHLYGENNNPVVGKLLNADQIMAEKKEDYGVLCRSLAEFPVEAVVQALRVLEADVVDRSEKALGYTKWLLELYRRIENLRGPRRSNILWLATATAPPGWCHVKNNVISTLLADVVAGLPFESIKRRWNEKMHPLQYQRPTSIKEGNLKQANETIEKLGATGSLQRRFARTSDILSTIWTPKAEMQDTIKEKKGGAFDHLIASKKGVKEVELPSMKVSWEKFQRDILPIVTSMDVYIPYDNGAFFALVTAANPEAPPILQWDGLDGFPRNPVSWYFYHGGSMPSQWGIAAPAWVSVGVVCLKPCYWQQPEKFHHQGSGIFFTLPSAKPKRTVGGSFFPENLRTEYHSIRQAMEAYSNSADVHEGAEGDANGICLDEKSSLSLRVKVLGSSQYARYEVVYGG